MPSDPQKENFMDEFMKPVEMEKATRDAEQELSGWLSGARDVTELPTVAVTFPEIKVVSEITFNKKHLEGFLKLDGIRWNDFDRQIKVSELSVQDSRMRTYRKMYERMGLIFHDLDADSIKISLLGKKIKTLSDNLSLRLNDLVKIEKQDILAEIREIAVSVLSKYQLRNPADKTNSLPESCDVLPCICIWKTMLELDNKLHYQEINRVLMKVMRMDDLDAAIEKIKQARITLPNYAHAESSQIEQHLGDGLVDEEQTSARIAPWFSFAGWGGLIIERENQADGFRHLISDSIPLIQQSVLNPPMYFDADNEKEWFDYYLSDLKIEKRRQTINDLLPKFNIDLALAGLTYEKNFIRRFVASCETKPFVILTGLSGSGKTKLAEGFAMWICESKKQYCIVPVGADWTNREPLLGFPNALHSGSYVKPDNNALDLIIEASKPENDAKPFFLILDEMNLSHVERYFADFLSVMESGGEISLHTGDDNWGDVPAKIKLPPNLFIIGTVNIDETTYMFSPKVLDRANVIEFRVTADEMKKYLGDSKGLDLNVLKAAGSNLAASFVRIAGEKLDVEDPYELNELKDELLKFFGELKKTGAEFGYRSASEIYRFAAVVKKIEPGWKMVDIIDAAIMQKLLPKVHGSRGKLEGVLKTLGTLCLDDGEKFEDFLKPDLDINYESDERIKYRISFEKIMRMNQGLIDNRFTSYAEA